MREVVAIKYRKTKGELAAFYVNAGPLQPRQPGGAGDSPACVSDPPAQQRGANDE